MTDLDKLLPVLNSSKIQASNPSLYQVIKQLIDSLKLALSSISSSSSSSSGGTIQSKIIILSDAQIKTLPTVDVTLINGPSPGSRIKVFAATLASQITVPYTNIDATFSALQLTNPAGQWIGVIVNDNSTVPALVQINGFLGVAFGVLVDLMIPWSISVANGAPGFSQYVLPNNDSAPGDITANWDGSSVIFNMNNNGSGNLTGGNAANTLKITVYYTIEKL